MRSQPQQGSKTHAAACLATEKHCGEGLIFPESSDFHGNMADDTLNQSAGFDGVIKDGRGSD